MTKRGCHPSIILISFLLIFNSAGCQAAPAPATQVEPTITPTLATATATASATRTPTPANTPTRTRAFIKSPTSPQVFFPATVSIPNGPAANYRLRSWTEVDSDELVSAVLRMQDDYRGNRVDFAKWFFCAERLLRYPDSPYWSAWKWDLMNFNPEGIPLPGIRSDQSYFSFLVEHMLNEEGIKPENIPSALEGHDILVTDPVYDGAMVINNFLGDGKPAYIFRVFLSNNQVVGPDMAIFVIYQNSEDYRVDMLLEWSYSGILGAYQNYSFQKGKDLDGNGLPELIIEENYNVHDGLGNFADTTMIDIFEWNLMKKDFNKYRIILSGQFNSFLNTGFTEEWEFGERDASGTIPIIVTRQMLDNTGENQQFSHPWNEIRQHLIPREKWFWKRTDLISKTDEKAKQLLFAERDYSGTIYYLNELLYSLTPMSMNYPERQYSYFHYLLGLAYEMNNQPELAAQTYYQVWQEAPESLFGMAARFKLEPNK